MHKMNRKLYPLQGTLPWYSHQTVQSLPVILFNEPLKPPTSSNSPPSLWMWMYLPKPHNYMYMMLCFHEEEVTGSTKPSGDRLE